MKHLRLIKFILPTLLLLFVASDVFAGRQWASGLEGKHQKRGEGGKSSLWIKFGPSIGSIKFNYHAISEYSDGFDNPTMLGVITEFGIRVYQSKTSDKMGWAIDVPFLASVHEQEFELDRFKIMGQVVPTAHLILETAGGAQLSPYLGYGGGAVFHIDDDSWGGDNKFDQIWTLRLGTDFMFNRQTGVSLAYMSTAIKYKYDYQDYYYNPDTFESGYITREFNESYNYWQVVLSIVFHP